MPLRIYLPTNFENPLQEACSGFQIAAMTLQILFEKQPVILKLVLKTGHPMLICSLEEIDQYIEKEIWNRNSDQVFGTAFRISTVPGTISFFTENSYLFFSLRRQRKIAHLQKVGTDGTQLFLYAFKNRYSFLYPPRSLKITKLMKLKLCVHWS